MKRYLLFSGNTYYASGGWKDYKSDHETQEEAEAFGKNSEDDWWHVVDIETMEEISGIGRART